MRLIAIAALVLAAPLSVQAQECAGGRAATAEGYCCWPGQHWDVDHARCDGPPSCPAPLAASGNECIAEGVVPPAEAPPPAPPQMVAADGTIDYGSGASHPVEPAPPPAPVVVAPVGEIGTGWPSAGQVPPEGSRNPHQVTRSNEALQIGGIVPLGVGFLGAAVAAPAAFASGGYDTIPRGSDRSCHDAVAGSLLIPVVGGFIAWGLQQNCTTAHYVHDGGTAFLAGTQASAVRYTMTAWAVIGALSAAVQVVGLGLLIIGSLQSMQVTVYDSPTARIGIGPTLGGAWGADATIRF